MARQLDSYCRCFASILAGLWRHLNCLSVVPIGPMVFNIYFTISTVSLSWNKWASKWCLHVVVLFCLIVYGTIHTAIKRGRKRPKHSSSVYLKFLQDVFSGMVSSSTPPPPPKYMCLYNCTLYTIQRVGGEGGSVGLCWRSYHSVLLHFVLYCMWPDSEPTIFLYHPHGQKPRRGGGLRTIISSRKVLSRLILRRRERRDFAFPSRVRVLSFYAVFQMNVPQME
jgi:hypothetical protein